MPFKATIPAEKKRACKEAYESSSDGCKVIGEKFGVEGQTIQTWARREGWLRPGTPAAVSLQRKARVSLERKMESLVASKAITLTDRAAAFRQRAIETSEKFMNTLERLSNQLEESGQLDPELVQKAVSAHKMMIETGFKVHGIDEGAKNVKIGLFLPVFERGQEPANATLPATIEVETVSPAAEESSTDGSSVEDQPLEQMPWQ